MIKKIILLLFVFAGVSSCTDETISGYQGYVEGNFVYISSPFPGKLLKVFAQQGRIANSGDYIFEIDSEDESYSLQKTSSDLAAAKATLMDMKKGKRPSEIEIVKYQLLQAKSEATKSKILLDKDQTLFFKKIISNIQLENSKAAAARDQARISEIESQLQVSSLPARQEQVLAQEENVKSVEASYNQLLFRIKQKKPKTINTSRVIETLFREGEWVSANEPVVKLLPPENVKIKFFIPQEKLPKITIDKKVRITCDGCEGEINASVYFISPTAEYTPPMIYSNESRKKLVYLIEARVEKKHLSSLSIGQPVKVLQ